MAWQIRVLASVMVCLGCSEPAKFSRTATHAPEVETIDIEKASVGTEPTTTLSITPKQSVVPIGLRQEFKATMVNEDGDKVDVTDKVAWQSSDDAIASFAEDQPGAVKMNALGKARITAVLGEETARATAIASSVKLVGLVLKADANDLPVGTELPVQAIGRFSDNSEKDLSAQAEWLSSDDATLTVGANESGGTVVEGIQPGIATVSAKVNGVPARLEIEVNEATLTGMRIVASKLSWPLGTGDTLVAMGEFTDNQPRDVTNLVTWRSSNNSIITVSDGVGSPKGAFLARGQGSAVITATAEGGDITHSITLNVTAAVLEQIVVSPPQNLATGEQKYAAAYGKYTNRSGADVDITKLVAWTSKNNSLAAFSPLSNQKGLLEGVSPGRSEIQAALEGVTGTAVVTINPPRLVSFQISPTSKSLALGAAPFRFTATANFTDGPRNVTSSAQWSTNSPAFSVNNTTSKGSVTALRLGNGLVSASYGGESSDAVVIVDQGVLEYSQGNIFQIGDGIFDPNTACAANLSLGGAVGSMYRFIFAVVEPVTTMTINIRQLCGLDYNGQYNKIRLVRPNGTMITRYPQYSDNGLTQVLTVSNLPIGQYELRFEAGLAPVGTIIQSSNTPAGIVSRDDFLVGDIHINADGRLNKVGIQSCQLDEFEQIQSCQNL